VRAGSIDRDGTARHIINRVLNSLAAANARVVQRATDIRRRRRWRWRIWWSRVRWSVSAAHQARGDKARHGTRRSKLLEQSMGNDQHRTEIIYGAPLSTFVAHPPEPLSMILSEVPA